MQKQIEQVKAFREAFSLPVSNVPNIDPQTVQLQADLLQEEVDELKKATREGNQVETLDGIVDCIYILLGRAIESGFGDLLPAAFDEIHRSNMSKLNADGKPIFREDGKVLKPATFSKPQLAPIIKDQYIKLFESTLKTNS